MQCSVISQYYCQAAKPSVQSTRRVGRRLVDAVLIAAFLLAYGAKARRAVYPVGKAYSKNYF